MPLTAPPGPLWTADAKEAHPFAHHAVAALWFSSNILTCSSQLVLRCPCRRCIGADKVLHPDYRPTKLKRLGVPLAERCSACSQVLGITTATLTVGILRLIG